MDKIIKKCPNCGAAIEHNYNHKCPYCRSYLHITDEEIKKLNNVDIRIKDVEIERSPIRRTILITLRGMSIPKTHWYEEGNTDIGEIVISGSDNWKQIGYRIEIPIEDFYESYYSGHFENILEKVEASLPPVFRENIYLVYDKILEKLYPKEGRLNI